MVLSLFRKMPKTVAAPREMVVAGRVMPLAVVENARARRLTLRIAPGGKGLRVTIPPGVPVREVDLFVERHRGWIENRLAKVPVEPALRSGAMLPVRGVPHRIVHAGGRGTVSVGEAGGEPVLLVHGAPEHLPRRLGDFLKREARRDIPVLVARHAKSVGRPASRIAFKDTKSRWGSCTSGGALSFSWRIMMAPPVVIDYLVAHEVAHLVEMNHGPRFWAECRRLSPRTDEARSWLKRNGDALQAISFE